MPNPRKVAGSVVKATEQAVSAAAEAALSTLAGREDAPEVPGAPAPEPPSFEEPTEPQGPLPPKPDQAGPDRRTATGAETEAAPSDVAQQGAFLTTSQGLRLRDTDHSLKAGTARPDAAAGPPPAREDHPLRPRAHPRAGGARPRRRRARRLRRLRQRRRRSAAAGFLGEGVRDAGLRPVLDRARLARLGRHGPRHPRVRDEVLHRRGHLRPGRQQHPGVLHPGRHQVPRRHPRRQAAAGPRDPAGAERARHVLGLRLAAHRGAAPHDVEHVRPRHPALLPDDGGLRRPHLPAA